MTVTGALAAGLLLVGCSTPLPEPEPEAAPAVPPPALTAAQVERILEDVSTVVAEGDEVHDAGLLGPRVAGPALDLRTAQYAEVEAGDEGAVTAIPEGTQTVVVPSTTQWPRTVMAVTEAPEDLRAPLLVTLVQDGPRSQFELWSWVRLFPGAQMPPTNQPELGSAEVDPEALLLTPEAVLEGYVALLDGDAEDEAAQAFDEEDDPLRAQIAAVRAGYEGLVVDKGTLTETYEPGADGVQVIGTAEGGAIVVGSVRTSTTITLEDSTVNLGGETAALLGQEVVAANLAIDWTSTVAFAVPPAGSEEPVRVLGAEHTLTEVTGE
ncbi:hypothetical protein J4G33_03385 [Actinotalea sp. BY-33]|uniref:DUF8094 domain-containing protein n=1 Tax=Actinotalea soli TaxID=2819234 RepID=A0A939LNM6_9CELL|nr:hypothetical protein [Actinotalea soli]MBO1750839.1 hypothetical protein [Actinotalea soli]